MLQLTTDKHEASRGLSATNELLVISIVVTQTHIHTRTQQENETEEEERKDITFQCAKDCLHIHNHVKM